jgi:hypothetical protein
VAIVQDEEKPEDWYLVINDPDGFPLRENTGEGMAFNNAYIVKTFMDCMDFKTNSLACKLATVPADHDDSELDKKCKLYAILTSTAKYKPLEEE